MDVDDQLRAWVDAELGPTCAWERLDAGRTSGVVYGLTVEADRTRFVVKRFASARGFAQERSALRDWFARDRRIHADHAGLHALLRPRSPGVPVDPDRADDQLEVHRAAGRWLAALHGLELRDPDPLPIGEAIVRRAAAWRSRATLSADQAETVRRHGPRPDELFSGSVRVPCHRDYVPRNWVWDRTELDVVDFEHARLDLAVADLSKLCVDVWAGRPRVESAFFEGYGRALSDLEREQLRACVVVHGLATLAWGQAKADPSYVDEGRRALDLAGVWPDRQPVD